MPELTSDEKIISRLQAGEEAMQPFAARDRSHTARYVDPSQAASSIVGSLIDDPLSAYEDRAVGNVPFVATNIKTKAAAVSFGEPNWFIESREPESIPIVKAFLSHMWQARRWKRLTEKALIKRCVSGMGIIAYRWDEKTGPELEHVHICDLIVDPFVVEWYDLRYAGRKIRMPRDEAIARWPDKADKFGPKLEKDTSSSDYRKTQSIEIKMYWDANTEAAFYGETQLYKEENLYEKVPLLIYEGDYDPRPGREFPHGDFDSVIGIQEMRVRLTDVINNQALHGGCLTLYNPDVFSTKARSQLELGREQGLLSCDDLENAIKRFPAEPLSEALMAADARMENAMDASQGVNQYMRGVVTQNPKFATQVGATNNLAGARGNVQRQEYEAFLNSIAHCVLTMVIKFAKPDRPEEQMLMAAIQAVTNIAAIEESTAYKDPAAETMAAAQDIQLLAPIAPMIGLNMNALVEDYLRARGKRDIQRYFSPPPQAAQMGQPAPGSAPGEAPLPPGAQGGAPPMGAPMAPPQGAPVGMPGGMPPPQLPMTAPGPVR